jgi:hypothetical protein
MYVLFSSVSVSDFAHTLTCVSQACVCSSVQCNILLFNFALFESCLHSCYHVITQPLWRMHTASLCLPRSHLKFDLQWYWRSVGCNISLSIVITCASLFPSIPLINIIHIWLGNVLNTQHKCVYYVLVSSEQCRVLSSGMTHLTFTAGVTSSLHVGTCLMLLMSCPCITMSTWINCKHIICQLSQNSMSAPSSYS